MSNSNISAKERAKMALMGAYMDFQNQRRISFISPRDGIFDERLDNDTRKMMAIYQFTFDALESIDDIQSMTDPLQIIKKATEIAKQQCFLLITGETHNGHQH